MHLFFAFVLAVFLWWCFSGSSRSSTCHGHGVTRADTSVHEAGHVVIAKKRGASGVSARVYDDGRGWTVAHERNATDLAVLVAAGTEATNHLLGRSDPTSRDDAELLEETCRKLDITPDDARRIARREVAKHSSEISRVAARLNEQGRI